MKKLWQTKPLGECAKFLSGGTPSKSRPDFWEGEIPWASSGELTDPRLHDTSLHVTPDAVEAGSRMIPENTILAVVRGMSLAKEFRISLTTREMSFNQDLKALISKPGIDPVFLFYSLFARREYIRDRATEAAHGTKKLDTDVLAGVELPMPEHDVQIKVAAAARNYDDLIENNRRRMVLLEESARLLYREWFVRLRFPGHESTRIFNGVPEGWERRSIVDLVKRIPAGKLFSQETAQIEGSVPILDQGRTGVIGYHDEKPSVIASEDSPLIVFANHTCFQRLIFSPFSAIQNVLPFVPSPEYYRNIFWLHFATSERVSINAYKGHWPELMAKELIVPPPAIAENFGACVRDSLLQCQVLHRQNQKLRAARDLLLPKLMSGEIEV